MNIKKTYAMFLSPTGTTGKAVLGVAGGIGAPIATCDLTHPDTRRNFSHSFEKGEVAIAGFPVYAGRLPYDIEDFFDGLEGNSAPAVALVMYGNRDYNESLLELKMRLEEKGFEVIAGAAFLGEHTFSEKIATGRPDKNDLAIAADLGKRVAEILASDSRGILKVKGEYPFEFKGFDPAGTDKHPTHFKVKTNDYCTMCLLCIDNCPWRAIAQDDPKNIDYNKCMRCLRCLKNCPASAKYIDDERFLSWLPGFEEKLNVKRCEPEMFFPE